MSAAKNGWTVGRNGMVLAAAILGVAVAVPWVSLSAGAPAGDAALAQFVAAASPADAAQAATAVTASGATFDEAYGALRKGRVYKADVPRGIVKASHKLGDLTFNYQLEVPQTYDAAKSYQMRVQLHGGVGRPDPTPRSSGIGQAVPQRQVRVESGFDVHSSSRRPSTRSTPPSIQRSMDDSAPRR